LLDILDGWQRCHRSSWQHERVVRVVRVVSMGVVDIGAIKIALS
jgi:hypothetical protein